MTNAESKAEAPASEAAPCVLVTGASGFIGSALAPALASSFRVRTAHRAPEHLHEQAFAVGDLTADTDWRAALEGADAVVHLAGPAHARFDRDALRRAVVDGSAALVRQAADAGVRRFVFVSSIHASAKRTHGTPLAESIAPQPGDAYGEAKLAAEAVVMARTELNPIVLRPPLVFSPDAKGKFGQLLRLLDSDMPLPLGGVANRRNLISLTSLNAAIAAVLNAPPKSGVFHVCDEPAVSTTDIASLLRQGMGRARRLFTAPGFSALAPRALVESLEVDASQFRGVFGNTGVNVRDALIACGRDWKQRR